MRQERRLKVKAIARYPDHGAGASTCDAMEYMFMPVKNNPNCPDRVAWIGGDLDGYGIISRKASLVATALDCGHEHLPGRRYWHVVISCEPCTDQESRADAFQRLQQSAPLLAALHGAKRWVAILHCDTDRPHLHLIFANFDEEKYCRLTYDRSFLSKVQDMAWTPYLESGKGHHTGIRGPRGEAIAQLKGHRRQEDPEKSKAALEKLNAYCAGRVPTKRSADTLAVALDDLGVPASWYGVKLLTKKGKPMKNASVMIDGVVIRLSFYLRWLHGIERRRKPTPKRSRKAPEPTTVQPEPDLPSL
jgi:hypothetical protein